MNNDSEAYTNQNIQSLPGDGRTLQNDNVNVLLEKCVIAATEARQGANGANDVMDKMKSIANISSPTPVKNTILYDNQKPKIKMIRLGKDDYYVQATPSTLEANAVIRDLPPDVLLKLEYIMSKAGKYINKLDRIDIPGAIKAEGFIPKVQEYAYKLYVYAVAMKLHFDQPNNVPINRMIDIAKCILYYTTFIFKKNELIHCVTRTLQKYAPTVGANYSHKLVEFVWRSCYDTIDNVSADTIDSRLSSVLQSAHTTIEKIDADYLELDEVFACKDKFVSLQEQVCAAFKEVNNTNDTFQDTWKPIKQVMQLSQDDCSLEMLQQALSSTIKASNGAKSASKAYRVFAEYFNQFTPTINQMVSRCDAYVSACTHLAQPAGGDRTFGLRPYLGEIKERFATLNEAITKSNEAARLYQHAYDHYNNLCKAIQEAIACRRAV